MINDDLCLADTVHNMVRTMWKDDRELFEARLDYLQSLKALVLIDENMRLHERGRSGKFIRLLSLMIEEYQRFLSESDVDSALKNY